MRGVLCLDGVEDEELVAAASPLLQAFDAVEACCAYGDLAERELAYVLEQHGGPPPPPHHGPGGPDRDQAEAIAERGASLLRARGMQAAPCVVAGRDAGHALVEAAGEGATLILGAGHRAGVGPKSIGHVARFVVDHASVPVIVVRLPGAPGMRSTGRG